MAKHVISDGIRLTYPQLIDRIDNNLFAWRRLYQPWIVAVLAVANQPVSLAELCGAYPEGLNAWDSIDTLTTTEQRILSAIRTLEKNGIVERREEGITLNCGLSLNERLLLVERCMWTSLEGKSLRECLLPA